MSSSVPLLSLALAALVAGCLPRGSEPTGMPSTHHYARYGTPMAAPPAQPTALPQHAPPQHAPPHHAPVPVVTQPAPVAAPPPAPPAPVAPPPVVRPTAPGPTLAYPAPLTVGRPYLRPAPPPAAELARPKPSPSGQAPSFRVPLGPRRLRAQEPAIRFAQMSSAQCRKEVAARKLPIVFDNKGYAHVGLPVRITGPFHGITIRTAPRSSKHGVLDCRLALALDEMARVLVGHGVQAVHVGNTYRPGARVRGMRRRSQHAHALAADVSAFVDAKGKAIPVEGNWGASIGDTPCGPKAVMNTKSQRAHFMRDAVCDLARQGVFHHILTPSANHDHRNHFHFDIQRDAKNRFMQ